MIWGKSHNQKNAEELAYNMVVQQWHRKFAFVPRKLLNGRWIALEYVWARAEWKEPQGQYKGYWQWYYNKELPIDVPKLQNNPPVKNFSMGYYNDGRYSSHCVFCCEPHTEYPVCIQCRKAVLAFRSLADAS